VPAKWFAVARAAHIGDRGLGCERREEEILSISLYGVRTAVVFDQVVSVPEGAKCVAEL